MSATGFRRPLGPFSDPKRLAAPEIGSGACPALPPAVREAAQA